MEENLPICPYCGEKQIIYFRTIDGNYRRGYSVGCDNDDCPVMPETDLFADDPQIAIEASKLNGIKKILEAIFDKHTEYLVESDLGFMALESAFGDIYEKLNLK